jgi:hypothetical protein
VDELEEGLKRFVHEMGEMVLDLLGTLDVCKLEEELAEEIYLT